MVGRVGDARRAVRLASGSGRAERVACDAALHWRSLADGRHPPWVLSRTVLRP